MKRLLRLLSPNFLKFPFAGLALLALTGCAAFNGPSNNRRASSLMQYLYPGKTEHTEAPAIPTLTLPLRVGVAFVPEGSRDKPAYVRDDAQLPEVFKADLLKAVAGHFRELPFVKTIEIIPTAYLQPGGGFDNLQQLREMFGVDVVALVSFDQAQSTDQGFWSLTYWTIVGAYTIPAEKNQTTTLMDAAVFDIASRKLLFRAPGVSQVRGAATPVNLTESLRNDSRLGFQQAATNLVTNLKGELAAFQQRVKDRPEEIRVAHSPGYRAGAGGIGWVEAGLLLALTVVVCGNRLKR